MSREKRLLAWQVRSRSTCIVKWAYLLNSHFLEHSDSSLYVELIARDDDLVGSVKIAMFTIVNVEPGVYTGKTVDGVRGETRVVLWSRRSHWPSRHLWLRWTREWWTRHMGLTK